MTDLGANPNGQEPPLTLVTVDGNNNATFSGGFDRGAFSYTTARAGNNIVLINSGFSSSGQASVGIPGAQNIMWFSEQDNLLKRMGELHSGSQKLSESWLNNVWVRGYGEQSNVNTSVSGQSFRVQLWGVDIGTDKAWQLDAHNQLYTGLFIGYGEANQDFDHAYGSAGKSKAIHFGTYVTWVESSGWYADAVFKASHFDNNFTAYDPSYHPTSADYDNWGIGGSLELGRQIRFNNHWFIEPMLQASYMHLMGRNYNTAGTNELAVDQRDADILQFRGGARFGYNIESTKTGSLLQPYLKVAGVEQISSGGNISIDPGNWRPNLDGLRAEIGAGVIWQLTPNHQLHLDYEAAFGGKYDKPWGFNAGYRYRF